MRTTKSILGYVFAALTMTLTSFAALGQSYPDPSQVYIRSINGAGTGCMPGTVSGNISPDAKAFTLMFSQYVAQHGPNISRTEERKFCQINLDINIPAGWQYSVFKVDYRGYAGLDAGVTGQQQSTYYFQGLNGRTNQANFVTNLRGPYSGDYTLSDNVDLETWSPCGTTRSLNIKSSVLVQGLPQRSGIMTVDSIDGEFQQIYGMTWRRCN